MDDCKFAHLNVSNSSIETQIVIVKRGLDRNSIIINVYRPPSGDRLVFQDSVDTVLQELHRDRFADIYLLGDVNLDHHPSHKSKFTKNFENLINSYGLNQQITVPTRVTLTTSSTINVIYVRTNKKVSSFRKLCTLSDHYLVGCNRLLNYQKHLLTHFYGRSFKNYSREIAQDYYFSLDTLFIFEMNVANLVWETLLKIIYNCANKLCPKRRIQTRFDQPPWITKEILELIADKDSTFLDAYENNKPQLLPKARKLRTESKRHLEMHAPILSNKSWKT